MEKPKLRSSMVNSWKSRGSYCCLYRKEKKLHWELLEYQTVKCIGSDTTFENWLEEVDRQCNEVKAKEQTMKSKWFWCWIEWRTFSWMGLPLFVTRLVVYLNLIRLHFLFDYFFIESAIELNSNNRIQIKYFSNFVSPLSLTPILSVHTTKAAKFYSD